jgi:hypothetical protein
MEIIVEKAINLIKGLKGVVGIRELSNEDRDALIEFEFNRKRDIIPVVNTGLEECLKREFLLLLIKTPDFRCAPNPTVFLKTDKGRILGQELISPEEKEKYQCRDDVYFLSNDFVMFKIDKNATRTVGEKQLFILPSISFPELDVIKEIENVISCSPSTAGDYYLKNKYDYPDDPNLASILVGFSKK